jgi:type II secretory pathway component GspD/PulD (secretin)
MKRAACRLLLVLWVSTALRADQPLNEFEIYPLGGLDPTGAEQLARQLAGPDGSVVLDPKNDRLLILTTRERHQQLAEVFKKADISPRNVRIEVRFVGDTQEEESEASVRGSGQVVVGKETQAAITVRPTLRKETTTTSTDVTQTLLVASGREGYLRVGESVPYLDWFMDYGIQWGYLVQRVAWQEVGAYLVVQPTVLGDGPHVRVRLVPELSGTVEGRPLRTRFARVATEVDARDGESIRIGGLSKDESFYSRFLIGRSRSSSRGRLDIVLTPHLGPAPVTE